MSKDYKYFPIEEKQWNQLFLEATKNNNKKKVFELLQKAGNVYLDEYSIDHFIYELNNSKLSKINKEKFLEGLKNCKIVENIAIKNNTIFIKTTKVLIIVSKLSDVIPEIETINPSGKNKNIINKSCFRSEYISQVLPFPNSIITGYTYGIADRNKSIDTWVEFRNNKNEEFVIFPDNNTVYNKEGFYFLKHAEVIKKVSGDDLKGKTSVGKSNSYTELNAESLDFIDIDIDMGDDR